MRNKLFIILMAAVFTFGLCSLVQAGKGNGFPEGDHYNLNLIAKKSIPEDPGFFTCPDAASYQWDYFQTIAGSPGECNETGGILDNPEYCEKCTMADLQLCDAIIPSSQNVIFVPRTQTSNPIEILIQSGSARPNKGKKISDDYPVLTVTDWCTADFDGNKAEFKLPENNNGYGVYARLTGKPVVDDLETTWTFMTPSIELVQDEYGNDLYYFGTVGGAEGCTDSSGNILIDRIDDGKGNGKGKGVNKATDLTCLFNFSGQTCYVNDLCYYCPEEECDSPLVKVDPADWVHEWDFLCCNQYVDELGDPNDFSLDCPSEPINYDCTPPTEDCEIVEQVEICEWVCATSVTEGIETVPVDLMCKDYSNEGEGTWVFNMADFIDVLWKSNTTGAYVVQLRFYKL